MSGERRSNTRRSSVITDDGAAFALAASSVMNRSRSYVVIDRTPMQKEIAEHNAKIEAAKVEKRLKRDERRRLGVDRGNR